MTAELDAEIGEEPLGGPEFAPWELTFVHHRDDTYTLHVLRLTATVEQIVEQARRHRPDLTFNDEREPAETGAGDWLLRHRRSVRLLPW